jgi:hypothetical protein
MNRIPSGSVNARFAPWLASLDAGILVGDLLVLMKFSILFKG